MAIPLDRPLSTQFFVDGVPLYEPDADGGIQMEWNSIAAEGSGRTQDGVMHIEWVKRRIPKAKFSYKAVTKEQLAYMNNLVQGKTFQFTCPKEDGTPETFEAYCSTSSGSSYSTYFYNGLYRDFKFDIIGTGA